MEPSCLDSAGGLNRPTLATAYFRPRQKAPHFFPFTRATTSSTSQHFFSFRIVKRSSAQATSTASFDKVCLVILVLFTHSITGVANVAAPLSNLSRVDYLGLKSQSAHYSLTITITFSTRHEDYVSSLSHVFRGVRWLWPKQQQSEYYRVWRVRQYKQ